MSRIRCLDRRRAASVGLLTVLTGAAVCLAIALLAPRGHTQLGSVLGPERETLLYNGDLKTDSGGIEITSWGSGEARSVYEQVYVGPEVLKVTSQGPYQGVVLHLGRERDLTEFVADKCSYVDLRILPAQVPRARQEREREREARRAQTRSGRAGGAGGAAAAGGGRRNGGGGAGGGGARGGRGGGRRGWLDPGVAGDPEFQVALTGGMGAGAGGRRAGGGGGRGGGAAAGAGAAGGRPAGQPATAQPRAQATPGERGFTLTRLRVTLFTDQGPLTADSGPLANSARDQRGWYQVSIALSRFRGAERARTLRAVGVYADQADTFYLGQIRLVSDQTPMKLAVRVTPSITFTGRVVDCSATLAAGTLDLDPEFAWDFDQSDGLQKQAVGREAKYIYKKPGDYLVTCTVTDRSGVREPVSQTVGVRVEAGATSGG